MKELLMTPGPVELHPRVREAISRQVISHRGPEFHRLIESMVDKARKVFQTNGDIFVLTSSATLGVECALANLLEPGERVLIPIHGVFGSRMAETAEAYGARVTKLELPWDEAASPEALAEALEGNRDLKAVALVHNETSIGGMVRELRGIAELVKGEGRLLIVDAVSSLGGIPLPVDELGIDVCVVGAQKCLAGPPGLTLISVSEEAWTKISRRHSRPPPYIDLKRHSEYLKRLETPFTPAVNLLYGLDEALRIILEEGLKGWQERHARCSALLYKLIDSMNLKPYPREEFRSVTVIAIHLPNGVTASAIVKEMEKLGVVAAKGMDRLRERIIRLACMGNINEGKVKRAAEALQQALNNLKISKP